MDKYPSFISWEDFLKIQTMIKDNHAAYSMEKKRGVPRPGKALLHGIVYCGRCGHKMFVQYKPTTKYICHFLRRHYDEPICQGLMGDPIDDAVVKAFFEALAPAEIDMFNQAMALKKADSERTSTARKKQLDRLRYQAQIAERRYQNVDPENRLVASELEKRWESAIAELHEAERLFTSEQEKEKVPVLITQKMKTELANLGANISKIWEKELDRERKKALLRTLIEKVVVERVRRENIAIRVVWKGGKISEFTIQTIVMALKELDRFDELQDEIKKLFLQGFDDQDIAATLTKKGFHSPASTELLPSTVITIRHRKRLLKKPRSHPSLSGFLTVSQMAKKLEVQDSWIYSKIRWGKITVEKNNELNCYLFPDTRETLNTLVRLKTKKHNEHHNRKGI
jgi:hypothetical protein